MKRKKCYIYMRVSTAMQVDGYSLEAQKDRLTKFAEFQKMDVVREYCDAGKSGKNITGRPEFSQMLRNIADGRDGVDYILVFKLSTNHEGLSQPIMKIGGGWLHYCFSFLF